MRSSLMSGLSLRLAKTSVEGGAPSFFADKTGDTVCDDCLFFYHRICISSALAWIYYWVQRGSEEESASKNSLFCLFAPSKNKNYLGFRKKALHFTLLSL